MRASSVPLLLVPVVLVPAVFLVVAGCGAPARVAGPEDEPTFARSPSSSPSTSDSEPREIDPGEAHLLERLGEPPWRTKLLAGTHHYSNGCTDFRTVEIVGLDNGKVRLPIILGWTAPSPDRIQDPVFFKRRHHAALGSPECVIIHGSLVSYAHEGISGAAAWAVRADHVEPAACPPDAAP